VGIIVIILLITITWLLLRVRKGEIASALSNSRESEIPPAQVIPAASVQHDRQLWIDTCVTSPTAPSQAAMRTTGASDEPGPFELDADPGQIEHVISQTIHSWKKYS